MHEIEKNLMKLYRGMFNSLNIDKKTGFFNTNGNIKSKNCRFLGCPYIGDKYFDSKIKILFYGLDVAYDVGAKDTKYCNFKTRRKRFKQIPLKSYNPMMSVMYRITYGLLNQEYKFSVSDALSQCRKISELKKIADKLPNNVLDYIAFSNMHKFTRIKDDFKSANIYREVFSKWHNKLFDSYRIAFEALTLKPDIIVFISDYEEPRYFGTIRDVLHYRNYLIPHAYRGRMYEISLLDYIVEDIKIELKKPQILWGDVPEEEDFSDI